MHAIAVGWLPTVSSSPIIPMLLLLVGILFLAIGYLKTIKIRSLIIQTEDWERAMFICAGILFSLYSLSMFMRLL